MADNISIEHRSWNMSRIRNKDTKPELLVRSIIHRLRYRFTINAKNNKKLPGKPDIVLPKYRTVIFASWMLLARSCRLQGFQNTEDSLEMVAKENRGKYWAR